MRTIIVVLFVFIFLVVSLPIQGILWIIGKFARDWADMVSLRIVQWAFRMVYILSGVKLNIIGQENVPTDEPVLYIGNHRSIFDTVITYSLCPGKTGYISKKTMGKVPGLNIWMKRLYCLFLDRDDIKQGLKVILTAIDQVKNGISMCVFPEGTRCKESDSTAMLPFKEGTFKIATKTGCKIVPMALTHTDDVLENHLPWIRRTRVTLEYGKPIDPKELSKDELKHVGGYCHEVIQNMLRKNA